MRYNGPFGLSHGHRLPVFALAATLALLLVGCDGEGLVPGSADAISRVEVDPETGDFLALHQRLLLDDDATIDVAAGAPPAPGELPRFTVHRSPDGRRWQRTSLVHTELEWTRESHGCVHEACFEIKNGNLEGTPSGEIAFTLDEVPTCFDGEPGSESCLETQSISRPLDLVVRTGEDARFVAALGTHGVAVYDGFEWSFSSVNTPAPERWIWQNLDRVATVGIIIAITLLLFMFFAVYRSRHQPDPLR